MKTQNTFHIYVLIEPSGRVTSRMSMWRKELQMKASTPTYSWASLYKIGWRIKKAKCVVIE